MTNMGGPPPVNGKTSWTRSLCVGWRNRLRQFSVSMVAFVAICAAVVGVAEARRRNDLDRAIECPVRWSSPDTIRTATGNTIFVESPVVSPLGPGLFITGMTPLVSNAAGEVVVHDPEMRRYTHGGFYIGREGTALPISQPSHSDEMQWPRISTAKNGRILVTWAPDDSSRRRREIWSTEFDGERWSDPTRVVSLPRISWTNSGPSQPTWLGNQSLLAVPADMGKGMVAVFLKRSEGSWHATPTLIDAPAYLRSSETIGSDVLLAYVVGVDPLGNTLFVQRFSQALEAVGPPQRISDSTGIVHWPQLLSSGDSIHHLVWAYHAPGEGQGFALGLATSRDGGLTWLRSQPLRISGGFAGPLANVDGRGRPHVGIRLTSVNGLLPTHLMWDGSHWNSTSPPTGGASSITIPMVAIQGSDSVQLIWNSDPDPGASSRPPVLVRSSGTITCR